MKLRRLKKLQAYKSSHFLREVGRGFVKRMLTDAELRAWIAKNYPPGRERGDDYDSL
jgi:hypothetical protein